jgi:hypothetical protein
VAPGDLWRYVRTWDVAIAPFKPGPLASSIDPIKAYEYLYFGLPIVCSGIPHLASFPSTTVTESVHSFVDACGKMCAGIPDYEAMRQFLASCSWSARFNRMQSAIPSHGLRSLYAP